MKSICLNAEEVHSLQSGPVTLYRPIKYKEFQPSQTPGYDWTFRYRSCWNDFTTENLLASKKHAPYKVGMELIVREAFLSGSTFVLTGGIYIKFLSNKHSFIS